MTVHNYCLLPACPNPLSDEELFCNHLVTVEALFSVTTCHPLYQIHMHLKPCKLRMRELLIVRFIWCCHGLSMWSISHLSLKAVFEKLYLKLYQNCYFGCYINWQITSCYTNKETYYSFHVERYYCQPFCHQQVFWIASNSSGLCCTLAQRDAVLWVS